MAELLQARYDQAAQRWTEVSLDYSDFAAHVHDVAGPEFEQRHTDALFLAAACARGDVAALRIFDRTVLAHVTEVVRSLDTRPEFADEVKQRLRERLLVSEDGRPRILDYAGRGELEAWVNVSAIRTGLNVLRSERRSGKHIEPDWSRAMAAVRTGAPDLEAFKSRHRVQFESALADACAALDDRHRAVLRLHFVEGLGIDRIAAVYAVHRSTAARWIVDAREQLREATRARLIEDHGIPQSQASFVERLVMSQLDVSFSQILGAPKE